MTKNNIFSISIFIISLFFVGCINNTSVNSHRQKENFDFDWKFSKGDFAKASENDFDDSKWQPIDVPHDWSILDTFSKKASYSNKDGMDR